MPLIGNKIIIERLAKPTGCYGDTKNKISQKDAENYCNSCWPNEKNNFIKGFIWTQYLSKEDYKLYTKYPIQRNRIKKQIISLLEGKKPIQIWNDELILQFSKIITTGAYGDYAGLKSIKSKLAKFKELNDIK